MKKPQMPESQIQEVLYELITRLYIDRRTMMLSCSVLNLPQQILRLREKGVDIVSNPIKTKNKFHREVTFTQYKLRNKADAVKIYEQLKVNQAGIPGNALILY